MLCQSCGKRPANTHIKTIINGELTEHSLCSECAQKWDMAIHSSQATHLINFFSSFFGKILWKIHSAVLYVVPLYQIFSDTGKVGCADCYKTFFESVDAFHTKNARQYPPYRKIQWELLCR